MKYRGRIQYTETDRALMWERWRQGESLHAIARLFERNHSAIGGILSRTGGIRPSPRRRSHLALALVADHRAAPQPKNTLLGMLMAARDEDGSAMSDQQLRDESITLFLAGHETTAITLSWTLWLLSQHPEIEARLAQELAALKGAPPQAADLPRLRYTDWVVKESMRLYPPAYLIGREPIQPDTLGGYSIPAGAVIYFSAWALHRNPRHFPEPDRFKPERWDNELERRLPRFAYMPFGGGPRTCIGDRFALMEAVLLLAALVQRFRFEYLGTEPPTPYPSITLRPMQGVPMRLSARNDDPELMAPVELETEQQALQLT